MNPAARFVIFDLFNTLVHGAGHNWELAVTEMAVILGVDPADLIAAYNATWRRRQVEWDTEQTVRILSERAGGSPTQDQVTRAAAIRRALAGRILSTAQGSTLKVLDSLRDAGFRIGLVSNATGDTAEAWPGSELAERFDAAIFSCNIGVAKPDPRIFLAAMTALGARPGECVYVGDGADSELAAAAALGMTAVRTTQHTDSDPSWTGTSIASLAEVRGLLPPGFDSGLMSAPK